MAIDVAAQIRYWQDGSADDMEAAQTLLDAGKIRQAAFFVHLGCQRFASGHRVDPMVDQSIEQSVKRYLHAVRQEGIHAMRAILYGSRARGAGGPDSDIDLIVIAPEFDQAPDRALIERLWQLRARTDHRIEPVPCGEAEWAAPITARSIIEIAHREGIEIAA